MTGKFNVLTEVEESNPQHNHCAVPMEVCYGSAFVAIYTGIIDTRTQSS